MITYIWKITQHMVPNIDDTMGHKIKPKNILDMGQSVLFSTQQIETQHNHSKKCKGCIWTSVVQLVAKISERHRKC